MLCKDCLAQLVDALRELAYGTVQRRDDDTRPTDQLRRQGLLADLQDTVTRLDHLGPAAGGKVRGKGDVTTVEFHVAASHLADQARSTISVWAREVWEANRHLHLPTNYVEACEWMASLVKVLTVHPSAGTIHDAITGLADRVRRMVDLAPDLTYLGVCSGQLTDGQLCDWDLYADRDDDAIIQCPRCKGLHDVRARKNRMIKAMQDQLLPATELRTVLTRYMPQGVPPIGTIHRWASIGKLTKKPPMPGDNRPRYRVGDVLDLIAKQQQDDRGIMKTSDITDDQVIAACRAWRENPAGNSSIRNLMDATGAPRKVAFRAMERASSRGLINWGVSINYAWPTDTP